MKRFLLTLLMAVPLCAMEQELTEHEISQDDLIEARIRWAGSESRIRQLMFEAKNYAREIPCQYICQGKGHIADFDGKNQTVITYIAKDDKQTSIVQSYDDFIAFINNQELYEKAREKYLQLHPSVNRKWCAIL